MKGTQMKAKLVMIGLVMAVGMFAGRGNSPTVHSLEQRVTELEQAVTQLAQIADGQAQQLAAQSQQLAAQQQQLASHQSEIDRFAPLANEMQLVTWIDGSKTIHMATCDFWVEGAFSQFSNLSVPGNIYIMGEIIKE